MSRLGRKPGIVGSGGDGVGPMWLTVAASDAPDDIIARADYTCDGTADEVQINAALIAAGNLGGVWLSPGTFSVSATINVTSTTPTAVLLRGVMDGNFARTTIVKGASGSFPLITLGTGALYLVDIYLEDDASFGTSGNLISSGSTSTMTLERCDLSLDKTGVTAIAAGNNLTLRDTTIVSDGPCIVSTSATARIAIRGGEIYQYGNSGYAIDWQNTGNSSSHRIENCIIEGPGAIKIVGSTSSGRLIMNTVDVYIDYPETGIYFKGRELVLGDVAVRAFDLSLGLYFEGSTNTTVHLSNLHLRDCVTGGATFKNVNGGTINGLSVTIPGSEPSVGHGIKFDTCTKITASGLYVDNVGRHGVWLLDSDDLNIVSWSAHRCSQETDDTYSALIIDGDSDSNSVQGGLARYGGTNHTKYGIRVDDSTCDNNFVTNNDLLNSGDTANYSDTGTGTVTTAGNRV